MLLIIILIVVFVGSLLIGKLNNKSNLIFSGNLAMSVMLIITGIAHFIYTDGMVLMLPHFIPAKEFVIYATGILEIVAALGLLTKKYRKQTALMLMIFLILILPANFKAAYNNLDITTAQFEGPGPQYLFFRVPLQIAFILWVWYFSFKSQSY